MGAVRTWNIRYKTRHTSLVHIGNYSYHKLESLMFAVRPHSHCVHLTVNSDHFAKQHWVTSTVELSVRKKLRYVD